MTNVQPEPTIEELMSRPVRPKLFNIFVRRGTYLQMVLWFGTFLVFAAHGAWPTPDSNETNYIGKAKYFWDPTFCQGDRFYESADAHLIFYWAFGWVTKFFTLDQVAWIGRIVTWMGLAWSWQKMSNAIFRRSEFGPLAAALFAMFIDRLHMAGEWVIGGVEGKGFAYIFAWWAVAEMMEQHWRRVFILLGIASAFHIIVGGWVTLAALIVWAIIGRRYERFFQIMPSLLGGGIIAVPSLWAAIKLTQGVAPEVRAQANEIYVFERLAHHLLPLSFNDGNIARHFGLQIATALFVVGVLLMTRQNRKLDALVTPRTTTANDLQTRFLTLSLLVSIFSLVAIIGIVLNIALQDDAHRTLLASLMKYYWSRASDSFVPVLAAFAIWRVVEELRLQSLTASRIASLLLCLVITWDLSAQISHWPFTVPDIHTAKIEARPERKVVAGSANPNQNELEFEPLAWHDVCQWAKANTPEGTLFLTPRISVTFKWHAQRPELVTGKDLPQDAERIVAWWNLLNEVHSNAAAGINDPDTRWQSSLALLGSDGLRKICEKHHVTYAIVHYRAGAAWLPDKPVYKNNWFGVYGPYSPIPNQK